jgi:triacylglycerol lipase
MGTTRSLIAAVLGAVLTLLVVPGPASAEDTLPVPWTLGAAVPAQLLAPVSAPPGAND